MAFTRRTAVVTGAANGLGQEFAVALGRAGHLVAGWDIADLAETAKRVKAAGGEFLPVGMDVTDEQAVEDAMAEVVRRFGALHILVNNAGTTAHCLDHQRDQDGGFVVEGTTIQEPVSFAESLVDERNRRMWGARLAEVARAYRYWSGLLVMATDENTGLVELNASEEIVVTKRFSVIESDRMRRGLDFASSALRAAGAREVVWSGLSTTHMQGGVRMGSDPGRSVVNADGRAHDVDGRYVGDASLVPASLSVNPLLTIMALAAKVADAVSGSAA